MEKKIQALMKHLDIDFDEADTLIDEGDYLVLTDDEADEMTTEYIENSLWAFNSSFLAGETGLPKVIFDALSDKYEDANEAIKQLIPDFEDFVQTAIGLDGRGHFISGYDGEECEVDSFFIYRIN